MDPNMQKATESLQFKNFGSHEVILSSKDHLKMELYQLRIFRVLGEFRETSSSFLNHVQGYKKSNLHSLTQNFTSNKASLRPKGHLRV